jgi:hypothetical protein
VAVTGDEPVFVAIYAGIFPEPEVPKPTFAVLVHVKVVSVVGLLKLIAAPVAPLHRFTGEMGFTLVPGRTIILNVEGIPGQPLTEGVTVIFAVMLLVLLLTGT